MTKRKGDFNFIEQLIPLQRECDDTWNKIFSVFRKNAKQLIEGKEQAMKAKEMRTIKLGETKLVSFMAYDKENKPHFTPFRNQSTTSIRDIPRKCSSTESDDI